jgi:hypothetical protein
MGRSLWIRFNKSFRQVFVIAWRENRSKTCRTASPAESLEPTKSGSGIKEKSCRWTNSSASEVLASDSLDDGEVLKSSLLKSFSAASSVPSFEFPASLSRLPSCASNERFPSSSVELASSERSEWTGGSLPSLFLFHLCRVDRGTYKTKKYWIIK